MLVKQLEKQVDFVRRSLTTRVCQYFAVIMLPVLISLADFAGLFLQQPSQRNILISTKGAIAFAMLFVTLGLLKTSKIMNKRLNEIVRITKKETKRI